MTQWRLIDEAPHEKVVLLGWYGSENQWFSTVGLWENERWRDWFTRESVAPLRPNGGPTHWIEIPEPPPSIEPPLPSIKWYVPKLW